MKERGIAPLIIVAVIVAVAVVAGIGIYIATRGGSGEISLTPHDPILIEGNAGFTAANGVTAGSGTVDDPYVIENWVISASSAVGIYVMNTTAYFIIRRCLVENGWYADHEGINLFSVANGRIEDCTCDNNGTGIWLECSSNNTLISNTCNNNFSGIELDRGSDNNLVSNNTCSGNHRGIYLWDSCDNNTFTGNYLLNNTTPYVDWGTNNHWS